MQIVIDIDEKLVCEGFERQFTEEERNILIRAIGNGISLPKGHGDLIDRSKLVFYRCKENVMDCPPNYDFTCQNCDYGWTCRLNIDEAPTVIPADKGE